MLSNLSKMGRRAFTLVELIIVIVIVGILAAISIVGYQSVVDRAEEQAVKASLESVDREYRALDAFTIANGENVDVDDMTSFTGKLVFADAANDGLNSGDTATWTQDGVTGVLTFADATQAGSIVVTSS